MMLRFDTFEIPEELAADRRVGLFLKSNYKLTISDFVEFIGR